MKRWISHSQRIKKKRESSKKITKKKKRVDGSAVYELNELTDSLIDAIKLADPDLFRISSMYKCQYQATFFRHFLDF